MVRVAVRASPVFSEMLKATVPGPVLLLAEVTVRKEALDVTVQAQPLLVVTLIDPVAPTPATFSAEEPSAYEQDAAAGGVGVGDDGVSD